MYVVQFPADSVRRHSLQAELGRIWSPLEVYRQKYNYKVKMNMHGFA